MRPFLLALLLTACTDYNPHEQVECTGWSRTFNEGATCDAACNEPLPPDGGMCVFDINGAAVTAQTGSWHGFRGICSVDGDGARFVECR